MSDHDTMSPETDDEIRTRLQAFARHVAERTDTEAALRRMPHPSRRPAMRVVAVAACLVAVVIAAAVIESSDRQSIHVTGPSDSSTQPVDGPVTLARGDVQFVEASVSGGIGTPPDGGLDLPAGGGLGGSRLNVFVQEQDGQVTGQGLFKDFVYFPGNPRHDMTVEFECASASTEDVILGGLVTASSGTDPAAGTWIALLIREGDPDRAAFWWDDDVSSCREVLDAVPHPRPADRFVGVVHGDDIETGRSPS
jgi:hypothetical protein